MKLDITVSHVITLDDALLASLPAVLATLTTVTKGIPAMQTQLDQLTALSTQLAADVAASIANSDKLHAAITAAQGQLATLSAQVATLQAAGTVPDLQPVLDALAQADQTLVEATVRDAAPVAAVAPGTTPAA